MTAYLQERRARLAKAWELKQEVVLIAAGEPVSIPGAGDQTFPFLAHPEYRFLADRECAGGIVAFDPKEGWRDFVPDPTERERIWEGRTPADGDPASVLAAWLMGRRGRPLIVLGCPLPGITSDTKRTNELRDTLTHVRRVKDEVELARMRRAIAATTAGFAVAREHIRPGVSERTVQIEIEAEFARRGADRTSYDTIVATGTNSVVFHFTPTQREIADGELVLIDAGAEIDRYSADVTRTFPGGGRFTGLQRDLYALVLASQQRAISLCTVSTEYRDVHLAACRVLVEGLLSLGILRGAVDALIEKEAHTLFFPHGIGHMVGLGVRDASGLFPGRTRVERPGLSTLRMDLPLEANYVVTIEPGLYFIPALLNDPQRRERYRDLVVWDRVEKFLDFGGIRIEDNIRITLDGPEVLTAAIPK